MRPMDSVLVRLSPWLHLSRITTAFAAVGNAWFVVLWTRSMPEERAFAPGVLTEQSLGVLLGGAALNAVGLFIFANGLNDALDMRRDRALYPDRPLASGRLSLESASLFIAFSMLAAISGALVMGLPAVLMTVLAAGAILFFHAAGKYLPSVGIVLLGLIYGAQTMTPNAYLVFVWPVLLLMAHALFAGALTHLLGRKRPTLTATMLSATLAGWAFWSGVLLYVGWLRAGGIWPEWVPLHAAIAPGFLCVAFVFYAWHKGRSTRDRARAAEKIQRYGALWAPLYATAWLIGVGRLREGAYLAGLALAGLLGMTVLREIYGLIEQPVGYRR